MDAEIFRAIMDDDATLEQLEAIRDQREQATREANERAAAEEAARFRAEEEARIRAEAALRGEQIPMDAPADASSQDSE